MTKNELMNYILKYYNMILTLVLTVLYSPKEPVHFLGFFTSWIRISICPCGPGSRRHLFVRIRTYPDPKHCRRAPNLANYRYLETMRSLKMLGPFLGMHRISGVDLDPYWIRIQELPGSGSTHVNIG